MSCHGIFFAELMSRLLLLNVICTLSSALVQYLYGDLHFDSPPLYSEDPHTRLSKVDILMGSWLNLGLGCWVQRI